MFLFSNLTQILNLSAIYIIPFRFMNYKEESISLDKNTLKQLYALFFFNLLPRFVSFIPSIPTAGLQFCHNKYECNTNSCNHLTHN